MRQNLDNLSNDSLITVEEYAGMIGKSPAAVRADISRNPDSVPVCFKLPKSRRLLFRMGTVRKFFKNAISLEQEKSLQKKIKIIRLKLKLSQEDFAKKLGVSRIAVSMWESNVKKEGKSILPSQKNMIKMANLVEVSSEWLSDHAISVESFYEKIMGNKFNSLDKSQLDRRFRSGTKYNHLTKRMKTVLWITQRWLYGF